MAHTNISSKFRAACGPQQHFESEKIVKKGLWLFEVLLADLRSAKKMLKTIRRATKCSRTTHGAAATRILRFREFRWGLHEKTSTCVLKVIESIGNSSQNTHERKSAK